VVRDTVFAPAPDAIVNILGPDLFQRTVP
jgi:hypothetical protein